MNIYQLLNWDSEVFGLGVAKIIPEKLQENELKQALQELKSQGIKLVYWAADSKDDLSAQAAKSCMGFLADRKVTYLMKLSHDFKPDFDNSLIEEYSEKLPDSELEFLALQSGLYSRFRADPKIPEVKFEQVYKLWIKNSVNKQIAKSVKIIRKDQHIAGMVTLGEKSGRGDIGLLAVHPDYRGMQIGVNLVKAAQAWCVEQGYGYGQVVTQQDNIPACKLYEKCGYWVEKVEHFYHFWL